MKYKVEKGIPIPEPVRGDQSAYPWAEMEEGDSFFVTNDGDTYKNSNIVNRVKQRFTLWKLKNSDGHVDMKLIARKEDGGVRFWLVRKEA